VSDVFLDGEKVEFSGSRPASVGEVRVALEEALASGGRVLAALTIDGQPFDESNGERPAAGTRIEAHSLALAEALAQVSAALAPELAGLRDRARGLAHEVLRAPWAEMQQRCVQLVETAAGALQRAVEVAALAGEGSPPARAVSALATTIEAWMQAMQQQDAATIAVLLADEVTPAFDRLATVLAAKATP
jgi:hypothetical protein